MSIRPLDPRSPTWQQRLDAAACEAEVVDIARDYLATLTHQEYTYLPEGLRPRKIVDANDVTTYAFDLVRYECHEEGAQRLVHRLANVMSRAGIRLSQIMVTERARSGPHRRADDEPRST